MQRRVRVLTMEDRIAIATLYRMGLYKQAELAEKYGVSVPRISQIVNDPAYWTDAE